MKYSKPTLYLCNGEKADCRRISCYKNGGPCRHTIDSSAALHTEGARRFAPSGPNGEFLVEVDEEA